MAHSADRVQGLIDAYDEVFDHLEADAVGDGERAYGGVLRAAKGALVEDLAHEIVKLAWSGLGADSSRLSFDKKKVGIPIQAEYVDGIKDPVVKEHLKQNLDNYKYGLKVDLHVCVDNKFVLAVECKAFTENAMLKRILVDCELLRQQHPNLSFVLFQLESQLGGDYSSNADNPLGSPATHTLLSHFREVELNIITMLEGERKVDRPIHKPGYKKDLSPERIERALATFSKLLAPHKQLP